MNRHNLQRMADYIRTVPQEKFSMDLYRHGREQKHRCGSVGCVIGHCTILGDEHIPRHDNGNIDFETFSEDFTGLDAGRSAWNWCFSDQWHYTDNTPTGAALRIEWLLNNGLPENWDDQMNGRAPLCYLPQTSN